MTRPDVPESFYVAVWPCGCALATCVIDPEHAKFTAKSVSDWIKDGATIEVWNREQINKFPRRTPECEMHKRKA